MTVPAEVRHLLGFAPGLSLEWGAEGDVVLVRRGKRFTSGDVHATLFPVGPPAADYANSTSPPSLYGVETSVSGEILVSGMLQGTANFGGTDLSAPTMSAYALLVRFAPDGTWISDNAWGAPMSSAGILEPADHPDGTAVIIGSYAGTTNTVDFGQGPLPGDGSGAFVAKVVP